MGETILYKDFAEYKIRWLPRIRKNHPMKFPDLIIPVPQYATLYNSYQQVQDSERSQQLRAGEKRINSKVCLPVTDNPKHVYSVPYSFETETNLRRVLPPEADDNDLARAQSLLHSNLAPSTRRTLKSIEKTLLALFPERNIFQDPRPGDRSLLLVRLTQRKPDLAQSTQTKYVKAYNSILLNKGIKPPPETHIFKRFLTGHMNQKHNPREAAKAQVRQAHTKQSLTLLTHAFAMMGPQERNLWHTLRVQAVFTASLIAFWACARLSDLCGANTKGYSLRTTLLEKDLSLMTENNKVIGLEVFFGSEKVTQLAGSRVQLPKIPDGPLQALCPVRAYIRYQEMKARLRQTTEAPWLVDHDGRPISHQSLTRLMDLAVETIYSDPRLLHVLRKLRGHSFRAALPTHMQSMGDQLTDEERQFMGRWLTGTAYSLYCKDKTQIRFTAAQAVIGHLQRSHTV